MLVRLRSFFFLVFFFSVISFSLLSPFFCWSHNRVSPFPGVGLSLQPQYGMHSCISILLKSWAVCLFHLPSQLGYSTEDSSLWGYIETPLVGLDKLYTSLHCCKRNSQVTKMTRSSSSDIGMSVTYTCAKLCSSTLGCLCCVFWMHCVHPSPSATYGQSTCLCCQAPSSSSECVPTRLLCQTARLSQHVMHESLRHAQVHSDMQSSLKPARVHSGMCQFSWACMYKSVVHELTQECTSSFIGARVHAGMHEFTQAGMSSLSRECSFVQDARIQRVLEFLKAPSQLSDKDLAAKVCLLCTWCNCWHQTVKMHTLMSRVFACHAGNLA